MASEVFREDHLLSKLQQCLGKLNSSKPKQPDNERGIRVNKQNIIPQVHMQNNYPDSFIPLSHQPSKQQPNSHHQYNSNYAPKATHNHHPNRQPSYQSNKLQSPLQSINKCHDSHRRQSLDNRKSKQQEPIMIQTFGITQAYPRRRPTIPLNDYMGNHTQQHPKYYRPQIRNEQPTTTLNSNQPQQQSFQNYQSSTNSQRVSANQPPMEINAPSSRNNQERRYSIQNNTQKHTKNLYEYDKYERYDNCDKQDRYENHHEKYDKYDKYDKSNSYLVRQEKECVEGSKCNLEGPLQQQSILDNIKGKYDKANKKMIKEDDLPSRKKKNNDNSLKSSKIAKAQPWTIQQNLQAIIGDSNHTTAQKLKKINELNKKINEKIKHIINTFQPNIK